MFIRSKENNSQMNFSNTAYFYTGVGLGPEVVYRAKGKAFFREKKKAPSLIPRVGFALRLPRKTVSTLLKWLNFSRLLLKCISKTAKPAVTHPHRLPSPPETSI